MLYSIFTGGKAEVHLWPLLHMHNSKLGKKNNQSEDMVHLPKLPVQKETSHVQLC